MTPMSFYNRRQQRLVGEIRQPVGTPRGWAIITHGLAGHRGQPHMRLLAEAAVAAGYSTVFYDSTNSFGASGGTLDLLTPTTHLHDLEDVIAHVESHHKASGPYLLMGHSLGSFAVLTYTLTYPENVAALAPLSAVVGGDASWQSWQNADPKLFADWHRTGMYPKVNDLNPGQSGHISWAYMTDMKHYDLLRDAGQITVPTLLIVGDHDRSTPPHTQLQLKTAITGPAELHVLKDCGHTYHAAEQLAEVRAIVDGWLTGR